VAEQMLLEISREKLEASRRRLAEMGIAADGDSGTVSRDGFVVEYDFCEPLGLLTLTLRDKPWIVPAGMIRRRVVAALAAEGIYERK
jgi:hypothetical protein